ncbi:MAG: HAMP domain-containing histidine kinase [Planctomycetes bacterium]|nr:HAMP domain-containing histidine kinase [Planctomycetota bacterium]
MSLAWRILLIALLLNALTVGGVTVVVHLSQQEWFRNQRNELQASVQESFAEIERVYTPKVLLDAAADARQVRRLLLNESVRELYEDVIVANGRPPYDGVYLNPLGAVHRDPDHFPSAVIQAGLVQAREVDGLLRVADGYCRALRQAGTVVGYLWFQPKTQPALPRALPLWSSVVGVAVATLLFGVVLLWVTRRAIGRPLQVLGDAAADVARGRYDVRLPEHARIAELAPVVATFNRMAEQVEGHTQALERAVREAVEQAKQKERALVQSSRLASIGTLAAGVAHEINNPIGGMQNAVNRLLQQPGLADKQRTYLELVQEGLQRIGRIARRLLDFSPRPAAAGAFDVTKAIVGARELVEHRLAREGVEFVMDAAAGLPPVRGDANEIQQVLLNLLLNSLDAFGEKGGGGRIVVRVQAEGGGVRIDVDDDGPGMDSKDLGRVFDPFFTKKERPDASGLGMFISYSIVQNHGGDMTVESARGQGFHVRIQLPAAAPLPRSGQGAADPAAASSPPE